MNDDTFRCDGCLGTNLPVSKLKWVVYDTVRSRWGLGRMLFCAACVKDMTHKLEGHADTPVKPEPVGMICPICQHTVDDADYWCGDVGTCLRCSLNNMC